MAAAIILAGFRTSVIANVGAATLGSAAGALTLGTPIINGLVGEELPFIVQGAVVAGLFAILTDLIFERLGRALRPRLNQRASTAQRSTGGLAERRMSGPFAGKAAHLYRR